MEKKNGISKDVGRTGGGSFVYCELKELNQTYINQIQSATSEKELEDIRKSLFSTCFISYLVNPKEINADHKDYMQLSFQDKKRLLLELIDKNKLYVNLSDIADEDMRVSEKEKSFTHSFYGKDAN